MIKYKLICDYMPVDEMHSGQEVSIDPSELLKEYMRRYNEYNLKSRANAVIKLLPATFLNHSVLDVGCGGGYYSLIVARRGAVEIIAFDIETLLIKAAKLNLKGKLKLKIDGINGDCINLPFKDGVFDAVLCVGVFDRISKPGLLMDEVGRITRNNGCLILTSRNPFSLGNLLYRKRMKLYSFNRMREILQKRGFEVLRSAGANLIPYYEIGLFLKVRSILPSSIEKTLRKIDELLQTLSDKPPMNRFSGEIVYFGKRRYDSRTASLQETRLK